MQRSPALCQWRRAGEFFAVIVGQRLHYGRDWFETGDDRCADVIGCLARNFSEHGVTALTLDHADNRLLVALADYGVELPVADGAPRFDMQWALGDWPT